MNYWNQSNLVLRDKTKLCKLGATEYRAWLSSEQLYWNAANCQSSPPARTTGQWGGEILILIISIKDGRAISGHQVNHEKHLRGCSPKPSLRNRSKSRVSICVNINPGLGSFEQSILLLLWGSHYRVTIFSQPFTSTVINHAPFNYWFVINILNPFQILLLIFTSFFNLVLCVLLITLLNCHRLFQQTCWARHGLITCCFMCPMNPLLLRCLKYKQCYWKMINCT